MSEIHGAVGAYVMNALDGPELDEFETHLAGCATCQREVVEFRETATALSLLSRTAPPPSLKDSVMTAIAGVRVLPPEDGALQAQPGAEPAPRRALDEVPGDAVAPAEPVDELAVRRQRRMTRVLSLAVAAVTVVALVLGGWVVSLSQRPPVASASAETELLRAPDLKAYTIDLKDGGKATFIASKSLNKAMFSGGDLPALQANQTYQLWTLAGPLTAPTRVTPDALVGGGAAVKQWFTGPVAQSDALAISIEQAGGASAPTNVQGATAL
ncbi:MAG TPA: anti-sigma factor [Propionicimonas sp.]|jgi:hypothetical protein|uniref:anti-sigma factor n=1 Tax=Propionicimonas sp. TaxID=1955623 RepID=UPI002F3F5F64